MSKLHHIVKFIPKEHPILDIDSIFEQVEITTPISATTNGTVSATKPTTTEPFLTIDQFLLILKSNYSTVFYNSKRLAKLLIDNVGIYLSEPTSASSPSEIIPTPTSSASPLSNPLGESSTSLMISTISLVTPISPTPKSSTRKSNLQCVIFTRQSIKSGLEKHKKRLDQLIDPFLLSIGEFKPIEKKYRARHYVPEPFTLFVNDREKVLHEIEFRCGRRLRNISLTNFNESGDAPLKLCLEKGYTDLIDAILACATYTPERARIDFFSEILTDACESGNFPLVQLLMKLGAEINSTEVEWSALFAAASTGQLDICKYIISNGADVNHNDEMTALYAASGRGYLEICGLLLEAGADVNMMNKADRGTPIVAAVLKRQVEVVEFLINNGANLLVKHSSGYGLLYLAVSKGPIQTVEYLLSKGLNVNESHSITGRTPLHEAADQGRLELCKLLIKSGANVNSMDSRKNTPLFYAAEFGHFPVVQYLVSTCNANINHKNEMGRLCIWRAMEKANLDVIKFLVQKGCLIHDADHNGESAIELGKQMTSNLDKNSSSQRFFLAQFLSSIEK